MRLRIALLVAIPILLAVGCASRGEVDRRSREPVPEQMPTAIPAVVAAKTYLHRQYEPVTGLLRESPEVAPRRFWLATDNLLASWVLEYFAIPQEYGEITHGLLEVLREESVEWPPQVEKHGRVAKVGEFEVWNETREGPTYQDWREYANLAMLGALNLHNQGNAREAQSVFEEALQAFDGLGFSDKVNREGHGYYETYKLALALHVGRELDVEVPASLRAILVQRQAESGGFYTLYGQDGSVGDTNTETTSLVIMALEGPQ